MPRVSLVHQIREAVASHYKQMGLKECGKFDHMHHIKEKMTGWGAISKLRTDCGISRRDRIRAGKGKRRKL